MINRPNLYKIFWFTFLLLIIHCSLIWRGGRVAEGSGLLNRRTVVKLYREFESPPLRRRRTYPQNKKKLRIDSGLFLLRAIWNIMFTSCGVKSFKRGMSDRLRIWRIVWKSIMQGAAVLPKAACHGFWFIQSNLLRILKHADGKISWRRALVVNGWTSMSAYYEREFCAQGAPASGGESPPLRRRRTYPQNKKKFRIDSGLFCYKKHLVFTLNHD